MTVNHLEFQMSAQPKYEHNSTQYECIYYQKKTEKKLPTQTVASICRSSWNIFHDFKNEHVCFIDVKKTAQCENYCVRCKSVQWNIVDVLRQRHHRTTIASVQHHHTFHPRKIGYCCNGTNLQFSWSFQAANHKTKLPCSSSFRFSLFLCVPPQLVPFHFILSVFIIKLLTYIMFSLIRMGGVTKGRLFVCLVSHGMHLQLKFKTLQSFKWLYCWYSMLLQCINILLSEFITANEWKNLQKLSNSKR